jgi:hypothetical protein
MEGCGGTGRAETKDGPSRKTGIARQVNPGKGHRLAAPEHGWGKGYLAACWTDEGELSGAEGREVAKGAIRSLQAEGGEETTERGPPLQPVLADECRSGRSIETHPFQERRDRRDRMGHPGVLRLTARVTA